MHKIKDILSKPKSLQVIVFCYGSMVLLLVGIMLYRIGEQLLKWGI